MNPKVQMNLSVPQVVRENALAALHTHIYRSETKLRKVFKEIPDMDKSMVSQRERVHVSLCLLL
jgi:hypothetical protein